ncbi:RNA polymerase III-inhibiting protein maf1 [Rhizophlyctis rosea]|nr:RNA polymerase III-inhibiting protein maf1 [Rhizophlyctis rosea]
MKFMELEALEALNNQLSGLDAGDARIWGRAECYTCKSNGEEKRLKHYIDGKYDEKLLGEPEMLNAPAGGFSPSSFSPRSPISPFGPLNEPMCRKTLFYLLATLNAAYPDYDFSDIKPESFERIPSLSMVVSGVNNTLLAHLNIGSLEANVSEYIWTAIDEAIQLNECEIYSFNPDEDSEPDSEEGNLWSFYYFFYNRKQRRVLFFTARAVSFLVQPEEKDNIYVDTTDITMDDMTVNLEDEDENE